MLGEAYHWTLETILWEMTLPQIVKYCETRSARVERQNRQMERQREESSPSRNRSRQVSDAEARKLLQQQERKMREFEQRGQTAAANPDALPDLGDIFSAFGSGFAR